LVFEHVFLGWTLSKTFAAIINTLKALATIIHVAMEKGAMRVEDVSGNFWLVIGLIGIEPVSSHYLSASTVQEDQAAQSIFELL